MRNGGSRPISVPGVVDGALTIRQAANQEISFHVEFGDTQPGHHVQFEFILRPEHAELVRSALAAGADLDLSIEAWPPSVPCQVGIHVDR
ncbi:hypothetical protein GTY41_01690 [Streptomyces sp. SID685]|uniref:hypothetical protein n=1 Tax=Streptomyces sp. SID685 TaxID=2690322 RepID=UPI00136F6652|nr:hypothetical protein [Streptomyces sp. SID685]MYR83687.1 hypothetical protein [Streptomyces sp. SID685]